MLSKLKDIIERMYALAPFIEVKGRFLELRMHYNFANLFSKLSESTFYKEISKLK